MNPRIKRMGAEKPSQALNETSPFMGIDTLEILLV